MTNQMRGRKEINVENFWIPRRGNSCRLAEKQGEIQSSVFCERRYCLRTLKQKKKRTEQHPHDGLQKR